MDMVAVEVDPEDEAIGSVMGTMHSASGGEGQQYLGPTIWTEVYFEGSPECHPVLPSSLWLT